MKAEVSLPRLQEPPSVPILRQINTVYASTSHSINFDVNNIILDLRLGLPSGLFLSGFTTKTVHETLFFPVRATCPAHLIILHSISGTKFGEE